jgi:hypothetical protein
MIFLDDDAEMSEDGFWSGENPWLIRTSPEGGTQ